MAKNDFNELEFVRIGRRDFFTIPVSLFEQVKGRSYSIDRLYSLVPLILGNHNNLFWALKKDKNVRGVLWATMDILSEKLNVIAFSVDEEYQDGSLEGTRDFLRRFIKDFNEIKSDITLKEKINWVTSQPELFEKIGGQQPKTILIEV